MAEFLQQPVRIFTDLSYSALKNWSQEHRVVSKAEVLDCGPTPHFVVTYLSEIVFCPRREAGRSGLVGIRLLTWVGSRLP